MKPIPLAAEARRKTLYACGISDLQLEEVQNFLSDAIATAISCGNTGYSLEPQKVLDGQHSTYTIFLVCRTILNQTGYKVTYCGGHVQIDWE